MIKAPVSHQHKIQNLNIVLIFEMDCSTWPPDILNDFCFEKKTKQKISVALEIENYVGLEPFLSQHPSYSSLS